MSKVNIRVAISGCSGRMGRQLIKSFLFGVNNGQLPILSGVITHSTSKFVGHDIGKLVGKESIGIIVHDSIESICDDFDILIDFSNSEATLEYLEFCSANNKNMVIGTTGFTEEELFLIKRASMNIGIVFSPNFSIIMALMLKLLEKSASIIGHYSDIEIMEMHHRDKCDIPSGTALRMQQILKSVISMSDDKVMHSCFSTKKSSSEIKINAIRAGDTVGEHSVFFINMGERLEIIHRSFNRAIFAHGAIYSAIWLGRRKIGLFSMDDVLGLNSF